MHALKTYLSSPKLLHYALPVLMLYLLAGTIAQKYIGLYEATQIFFSSWILWIGPIPLPGLPIILAVMFINLCCKLAFKSPWNMSQAGIIITHISVLFLLLGGLFTALFSTEGALDFAVGETKAFVSDYHIREFAVTDENGTDIFILPRESLTPGRTIAIPSTPLSLEILEACRHCKIERRKNADETYISMAQHMQLTPAPLRHLDEENMSGLTFRVHGSDGDDGVYVTLEDIPKIPLIKTSKKTYGFALRRQKRTLPFDITLLDFTKDVHPGTAMAKAYQSRVRIKDGDAQWESIIRMNEPLRYKGYTFFQSSFIQTPEGNISVLAVVWNAGRAFPYISGLILCLGLIIHLIMRRKMARMFMGLALIFSAQTVQAQSYDISDFAQIPVLHEGRIKPIESFARANLKQLAGHDKNANEWLLETIFNPALAENQAIIKITNPDILNLLQLERSETKRYSYKTVLSALTSKQDILRSISNTEEEALTPAQKDLLFLQEKTAVMGELLGSLSLFLPLSVTLPQNVPEALKPYTDVPLTYYDVLKFREALELETKRIVAQKGDAIDSYNQAQQAITYLSFVVNNLRRTGTHNRLLRVIPGSNTQSWHAPWSVVTQGSGTPQTASFFALWQDLALSYHKQDYDGWKKAAHALKNKSTTLQNVRKNTLLAEHFYNTLHPFKISALMYALALALCLLCTFIPKLSATKKMSLALLFGGAALHTAGIAARIYILNRPPVSTLYESIIFVGLIAVLYGLWAYRKDKALFWLFLSAGAGVFLHVLGFSHDQDGDSMLMLSAVLNTNFWLATHVICITVGYAFCLITSILAHYAMFDTAIKRTQTPPHALFKNIHNAALLALLFSSVGTVLGGIWADQSWGRFWGWDPKENGALLIVLWLIWVIHGRISGQMSTLITTAGLAYTSVIVALSWFGVNLLGVGLHSYGFTDSLAFALAGFIAMETALIAGLIFFIKTKAEAAHAG